jgi:hypothetical protein
VGEESDLTELAMSWTVTLKLLGPLMLALLLAILAGCDATSGGLRTQTPSSPFPYNSPYY